MQKSVTSDDRLIYSLQVYKAPILLYHGEILTIKLLNGLYSFSLF
jgi:hypothetical protein